MLEITIGTDNKNVIIYVSTKLISVSKLKKFLDLRYSLMKNHLFDFKISLTQNIRQSVDNRIFFRHPEEKIFILDKNNKYFLSLFRPNILKHFIRILKNGYKKTIYNYFEFFISRKAIQYPLFYKLSLNHIFPIHSAAIEVRNGKAVMIVGASGSGKTFTMLKMLKNIEGSKFISDNFVLIDKNRKLIPFPEPIRIKKLDIQIARQLKITNLLDKTEIETFGKYNFLIKKRFMTKKKRLKISKIFILSKNEKTNINNSLINAQKNDIFIFDNNFVSKDKKEIYSSYFSFIKNITEKIEVKVINYNNFIDLEKNFHQR